jgi:hypothetical protein
MIIKSKMNPSIDRDLFCDIFLAFLMASPLLLYVTPVRGMAIYIYSALVPLIAFFYLVKGVRFDVFYIFMFFGGMLLFVGGGIFIIKNDYRSLLFVFNIFVSFLMATILWRRPRVAVIASLLAMIFLFFWYIYCLFYIGYTPSSANSYLYGASRNHVSFLLLLSLFLYYSTYIYHEKRFSLIPVIFMVPVSIQLYGRSGIIISLMLFIVVVFYAILEGKAGRRILLGLLFIFLSILLFAGLKTTVFNNVGTNFGDLSSILELESNLSSVRWEMNFEYIRSLDLSSFFFGSDLQSIQLIAEHDGNPHNSFVVGHSILGIFFLAPVVALACVICFRLLFRFGRKRLVISLLLFLLLLRASVDSLFFYSAFDFVLIYILILSFLSSGTKSGCSERGISEDHS